MPGLGRQGVRQGTRGQYLADAMEGITESTSDVVARRLAQGLARDIGDACFVSVLAADGRFIVPLVTDHWDPQTHAMIREVVMDPVPADAGITGEVLRTGRPVRMAGDTADLEGHCRPDIRTYVRAAGVKAICIVPLIHDEAVIGAVGIARDSSPVPYSAADEAEVLRRATEVAPSLAEARLRARDPSDDPLVDPETSFRHGFETALIGMAFLAPDGRFLRVNRALCELLSYDQAELLGRSAADLAHADDRGEIERTLRDGASGSWRTHRFDTRMIRRDGQIAWVHVSSRLMVGPDDRPGMYFCQYIDISDRKRAEMLLDESQRAGGVGSFEWLPGVDRTRWTREMYRIHGVDPVTYATTAEQYTSMIHPDDRELVAQAFAAALRARSGSVQVRFRFVRPGGELVTLETRGRVESTGDGRPLRVIGTVTEVAPAEQDPAALRDPLTGLATRSLMLERVRDTGRGRTATDGWSAMIVADLDGFSRVNLHRGAATGDEVLTEAARRVRGALRSDDLAARVAGDRMGAYCACIESSQAVEVIAQRIQRALEAPFRLRGGTVELTASVGVATAAPGVAAVPELLQSAEVALRRVKERGGGGIEFYDEQMHAHVLERSRLQDDIRTALRTGGFELHYQPMVALPRRELIGVEALLRWPDARFRHLPIEELIRAAERAGMIAELGEQVLNRALEAVARWRASGVELELSVNLSPRQLRDPALPRTVSRILEFHDVPASCLRLEVTESAAVEDPVRACALLAQLRDQGVRVALDDFGTGYSSLRHLHELPVQELKVDRSFVAALESDAQSAEPMISSIVRMAEALGLEVTAEGVETEFQLDSVSELGCERAQGFLFAKPMPEEALTRLLEEGGLAGRPRL